MKLQLVWRFINSKNVGAIIISCEWILGRRKLYCRARQLNNTITRTYLTSRSCRGAEDKFYTNIQKEEKQEETGATVVFMCMAHTLVKGQKFEGTCSDGPDPAAFLLGITLTTPSTLMKSFFVTKSFLV